MKNLTALMDRYFDQMDENWKALPRRSQHQYLLYFFTGYFLVTAGVIGRVLYDVSKSGSGIAIEHIENHVFQKKENSPAALQDTVSTNLKNETYERE